MTKYVNVNAETIAFINSAFEETGVTIAAAARKCGFSQPTLSRLMKGQTDFSVSRVFEILGALDRDPADFAAYLSENCIKSRGKSAAVSKPVKAVSGKKAARPTSAVAEKSATKTNGKIASKTVKPKSEIKVAVKGKAAPVKVASKPKVSAKTVIASKIAAHKSAKSARKVM